MPTALAISLTDIASKPFLEKRFNDSDIIFSLVIHKNSSQKYYCITLKCLIYINIYQTQIHINYN